MKKDRIEDNFFGEEIGKGRNFEDDINKPDRPFTKARPICKECKVNEVRKEGHICGKCEAARDQ